MMPFHWLDGRCREIIKIQAQGYEWSGYFRLSNNTIRMRDIEKQNNYILVRVEVQLMDISMYVSFN